MPDLGKEQVVFEAVGLDQIQAKVAETRKATEDLHATNVRLKESLRDGTFVRHARAIEQQKRAYQETRREAERLNREARRSVLADRYGRFGGAAAYYGRQAAPHAGNAAIAASRAAMGGAAAVGAAGVAGLQGSVQWNQFQAQLTLTGRELSQSFLPALREATNALRDFRQWYRHQSPRTQDAVSYGGLAAGAGFLVTLHPWGRQAAGWAGRMAGRGLGAGWNGLRGMFGGGEVAAARASSGARVTGVFDHLGNLVQGARPGQLALPAARGASMVPATSALATRGTSALALVGQAGEAAASFGTRAMRFVGKSGPAAAALLGLEAITSSIGTDIERRGWERRSKGRFKESEAYEFGYLEKFDAMGDPQEKRKAIRAELERVTKERAQEGGESRWAGVKGMFGFGKEKRLELDERSQLLGALYGETMGGPKLARRDKWVGEGGGFEGAEQTYLRLSEGFDKMVADNGQGQAQERTAKAAEDSLGVLGEIRDGFSKFGDTIVGKIVMSGGNPSVLAIRELIGV